MASQKDRYPISRRKSVHPPPRYTGKIPSCPSAERAHALGQRVVDIGRPPTCRLVRTPGGAAYARILPKEINWEPMEEGMGTQWLDYRALATSCTLPSSGPPPG